MGNGIRALKEQKKTHLFPHWRWYCKCCPLTRRYKKYVENWKNSDFLSAMVVLLIHAPSGSFLFLISPKSTKQINTNKINCDRGERPAHLDLFASHHEEPCIPSSLLLLPPEATPAPLVPMEVKGRHSNVTRNQHFTETGKIIENHLHNGGS